MADPLVTQGAASLRPVLNPTVFTGDLEEMVRRIVTLAESRGIERAARVVETHHISGYFCSCGAEINSQEAHHAQQIRALSESR